MSQTSSALQLNLMLSKIKNNEGNKDIQNIQQLITLFEDVNISTFDKMRIYYKNSDKLVIIRLPLSDIKKKIRFLTAICYNVLSGKYANLLGNILEDKKKISPCDDSELVGFSEFYELIAVVQLEMAIYNVDNNDHTYRFADMDDILTMKDVIETKYNKFISLVTDKYSVTV